MAMTTLTKVITYLNSQEQHIPELGLSLEHFKEITWDLSSMRTYRGSGASVVIDNVYSKWGETKLVLIEKYNPSYLVCKYNFRNGTDYTTQTTVECPFDCSLSYHLHIQEKNFRLDKYSVRKLGSFTYANYIEVYEL